MWVSAYEEFSIGVFSNTALEMNLLEGLAMRNLQASHHPFFQSALETANKNALCSQRVQSSGVALHGVSTNELSSAS